MYCIENAFVVHQSMMVTCYHRYSRGLGLVGPLLGEDHPLNVPNAIAGLVYYTVMMFLSECICMYSVYVCVCVYLHMHIRVYVSCVCTCVCVCKPSTAKLLKCISNIYILFYYRLLSAGNHQPSVIPGGHCGKHLS